MLLDQIWLHKSDSLPFMMCVCDCQYIGLILQPAGLLSRLVDVTIVDITSSSLFCLSAVNVFAAGCMMS